MNKENNRGLNINGVFIPFDTNMVSVEISSHGDPDGVFWTTKLMHTHPDAKNYMDEKVQKLVEALELYKDIPITVDEVAHWDSSSVNTIEYYKAHEALEAFKGDEDDRIRLL